MRIICQTCKGAGYIVTTPGVFETCEDCSGEGFFIKQEVKQEVEEPKKEQKKSGTFTELILYCFGLKEN